MNQALPESAITHDSDFIIFGGSGDLSIRKRNHGYDALSELLHQYGSDAKSGGCIVQRWGRVGLSRNGDGQWWCNGDGN